MLAIKTVNFFARTNIAVVDGGSIKRMRNIFIEQHKPFFLYLPQHRRSHTEYNLIDVAHTFFSISCRLPSSHLCLMSSFPYSFIYLFIFSILSVPCFYFSTSDIVRVGFSVAIGGLQFVFLLQSGVGERHTGSIGKCRSEGSHQSRCTIRW